MQCALTVISDYHNSPNPPLLHRLPAARPHPLLNRLPCRIPSKFLIDVAIHISHLRLLSCIMRALHHKSLSMVLPLLPTIARGEISLSEDIPRSSCTRQGSGRVCRRCDVFCNLRVVGPLVPVSEFERKRQRSPYH